VCCGSFFVLWNKKLVCFARFVCVVDHFCSLEQNLVFAFARFFCVVDHFCSLKQWGRYVFSLQTFVMGPNHNNTIWFCREDGGV